MANYRTIEEDALLHDTSWMRLGESYKLDKHEISTVEFLMMMPNYNFNDEISIQATLPVYLFEPNEYGLYNMGGNVEEIVINENVEGEDDILTKGGSWKDTGYETLLYKNHRTKSDKGKSNEIGFRLVVEVIQY